MLPGVDDLAVVEDDGLEDAIAAGDDPVGEGRGQGGAAVGVAEEELVEPGEQEHPACSMAVSLQDVWDRGVHQVLNPVDVETLQVWSGQGDTGPDVGGGQPGSPGEVGSGGGPVAAEVALGPLLDDQEQQLQQAILTGPPPLGPGAPPPERLVAFVDAYLDYAQRHLELVHMSETASPGARYHIGSYRFCTATSPCSYAKRATISTPTPLHTYC